MNSKDNYLNEYHIIETINKKIKNTGIPIIIY